MERLFSNEFSFTGSGIEYTPPGWVRMGNVWHPLGFKVVTEDNISLGLRKNPTRLHFPVGEWVKMKRSELILSKKDAGGIWSALNRGGANTLRQYMRNEKGVPARVYLAAIYNPIYANSYRVKSQGVMLLEELG
ncbi:MAG TPA: hypothetical protein VJ227_02110 [Patescibacteria group bacterium]|nr:hypothetical protein [Patescibacteria group bacterium]